MEAARAKTSNNCTSRKSWSAPSPTLPSRQQKKDIITNQSLCVKRMEEAGGGCTRDKLFKSFPRYQPADLPNFVIVAARRACMQRRWTAARSREISDIIYDVHVDLIAKWGKNAAIRHKNNNTKDCMSMKARRITPENHGSKDYWMTDSHFHISHFRSARFFCRSAIVTATHCIIIITLARCLRTYDIWYVLLSDVSISHSYHSHSIASTEIDGSYL